MPVPVEESLLTEKRICSFLDGRCVHQREIGSKVPIDRVNMYASFYKAVKL